MVDQRSTTHNTLDVGAENMVVPGADRRRSKQAGFDYHLTKPVELDELCRLLSTAKVSAPRP